jgi:signal transduction histidine kinase
LDIAARPAAPGRGRSKRISEQGSAGETSPGSGNSHNGDLSGESLKDALDRVEVERAHTARLLQQAEEDLSTASRRLEDADAVRRHLLENVASGGDEARRRFASALHDDALQLLTGAELQLERIRFDARKTKYAGQLDQMKLTLKKVEDSLRNLLYNVSPAGLDVHANLDAAIRDRLAVLKAHTGIEPELDLQLPRALPAAVKSIAFKNLSEALSNVEKHANATRVSIRAAVTDGSLVIEIADDGSGFVVAESLYLPGHLGLVAMRERAQLAGGWCRYESEPGAGTRVIFSVPIHV